MNRRLHHAVSRWLRAERAERAEEKALEADLRRVFQVLPAPSLPAGFTERVMQGAGLVPARRAAVPLGWRIVFAGALAVSGLAAALAPRIALGLIERVSSGDVLRFAAGAVVETCQRMAEGLTVWQTLSSIGDTFTQVLSTPSILTALLAATLLSAGGFRMLHGLLAIDRRSENARA